MKNGTEGFGNSLVGAFDGSILMGRIGASGFNGIAKAFKESTDFGEICRVRFLGQGDNICLWLRKGNVREEIASTNVQGEL
jgi:hypothetical protein